VPLFGGRKQSLSQPQQVARQQSAPPQAASPQAAPPQAPPPAKHDVDWADIELIRAEWPLDDANAEADLAAFHEGNQVYDDNDDYLSMLRSGALLSRSLRYELYGKGILRPDDVSLATFRVLFASAYPPPDERSFPHQAASQLRLAMTVAKKHGWQPAAWGGNDMLGESISRSVMVLAMAIAPEGRPWDGDVKGFFTTNPLHIEAPEPEPVHGNDSQYFREVMENIHGIQATIDAADAGDPAAHERVLGFQASQAGDDAAAQVHYERSAEMGNVGGMFDAGCGASRAGEREKAIGYFEAASNGGHKNAMKNLGAMLIQQSDIRGAAYWWQRAGEAGDPDGYAALTQLASDAGNDADELKWARLGAEADQPFCMLRYGQLLLNSDPRNPHFVTTQVIPWLLGASEAGKDSALFLIGIAYGEIGDIQNAGVWLRKAEAAGDPEAARVIQEHGL
jgi:hypothetical protein